MEDSSSVKKKKGLGLSDNPMDKLGFSNESSVSTPQAPKATALTEQSGVKPVNPSGLIGQPTVAEAMDPANQAVADKVNNKMKARKTSSL